MTFAQFLSILRARKWAALLVFGLVVVVTVVVSLLLPKQYEGAASVVIDIKPDPVSGPMVGAGGAGFIATQVDILLSDRVASRVIRDLKLSENEGLRTQWQDGGSKGSLEQFITDMLHRSLDVKPSRESSVISVTYTSAEPRFSAAVANAFAQAYIATTLELRADPAQNFKKFFDTRSQDAREALEKAQAKLSAFQQQAGIIATDERLDVENARLNELSSQVTQFQAISAESGSRQLQAQGGQSDRLQEVLTNPLLSGLKADISRGEARLQELSQRLGEANPQVVEAKANIAELRTRLDIETRRVTSGVGVSNNINRSREAQVRAALEAQRAKVLQMKAVRDEGIVLQREVDNAQRIYENLAARLSQTGLEALNTQSYASMLTVAQPPAQHTKPRVLLNVVLATVLGALLALSAALLLELADRRVRAPEDVVALLGLPVLGSLPVPGAKRFNPARPILRMHQSFALANADATTRNVQ